MHVTRNFREWKEDEGNSIKSGGIPPFSQYAKKGGATGQIAASGRSG